jgi:hypothetical protein
MDDFDLIMVFDFCPRVHRHIIHFPLLLPSTSLRSPLPKLKLVVLLCALMKNVFYFWWVKMSLSVVIFIVTSARLFAELLIRKNVDALFSDGM